MSPSGRLGTKIEHERQVRLQSAGGHLADSPQLVHLQPAGVPLINDIRQQVAIGDDRLTAGKRRAQALLDESGRAAMYKKASAGRLIGKSRRSSRIERIASPSGVLPGSRKVMTRWPRSASQAPNNSICVDFPAPSMPSKL